MKSVPFDFLGYIQGFGSWYSQNRILTVFVEQDTAFVTGSCPDVVVCSQGLLYIAVSMVTSPTRYVECLQVSH